MTYRFQVQDVVILHLFPVVVEADNIESALELAGIEGSHKAHGRTVQVVRKLDESADHLKQQHEQRRYDWQRRIMAARLAATFQGRVA